MTEVFPIIPGPIRSLWIMLPIFLLMVATMGVLGLSLGSARTARFEVSPAGLRLRGDIYGRLVPASALRVGEARAVDLNVDKSLAPSMRTMGTAVGGYRAGWFRLHNGEKALLYITDKSRVVYVPTTSGYSVLVSVADPAAFLQALRRATGASTS